MTSLTQVRGTAVKDGWLQEIKTKLRTEGCEGSSRPVCCAGKRINHFKQKDCISRPTGQKEFMCLLSFPVLEISLKVLWGKREEMSCTFRSKTVYFFVELALILHCSVELVSSLLYHLCQKMPPQLRSSNSCNLLYGDFSEVPTRV